MQVTYGWFKHQLALEYLWIQCDITKSVTQMLDNLHFLRKLKVLRLEELRGFTEEYFHAILKSLPELEVIF